MNYPIRTLSLAFCTTVFLAQAAVASITYEFRTTVDPTVIGTIEFAVPPASATMAWSSIDPADLISLFLDDALFGLGNGNVLDLFDDYLTYDVASLNGSELDFAFGIQDSTPGGGAGGVSDFVQLGFSSTPGQDVVESFANANFVVGDWTLQANIPVPSALFLMAPAVLGLGFVRRKRRH